VTCAVIEPLIFGCIITAVGGGVILYYMKQKAKARASLSWPSVEGEVFISKMEISEPRLGTRFISSISTFRAGIQYRYKIRNRRYTGKNIFVGPTVGLTLDSSANYYLAKYPWGKTVKVYYNPDNPKEACLERTVHGLLSFFAITTGGGFLLAGIACLLVGIACLVEEIIR